MATTNNVALLVSQLAEAMGDAVNDQAAHSLHWLANGNADRREAIVQARGIPALVALIRSAENREATTVLHTAVQALASLLSSDAAVQAAMECTAVPVLVRLLQHKSDWVQCEAAKALGNMAGSANGGAAIKDSICSAGALPPLVALLHDRNLMICRQEAALALWALATNSHTSQACIVAAGGVYALVAVLHTSRDAYALDNAAGALGSLASGNADVRAALTDAGAAQALEFVVKTTENQPKHKLARGRAQAALNCLVAAPVAEPPAAGAGEVLRQLAAADNPELRNRAFTALADLCATDAAAVVMAGGLQQIVQLAAQPNPDTAQQAARCLRHITAAHEQNRAAVAAGAVDALVALLRQELGAEDAVWALLNLANVGDPPQAGAAGAVPKQVRSQRAAIVHAGAVGPLVDLLDSDNDATVEAATAILGVLSKSKTDDENATAVRSAGAVTHFVSLLSSTERVQEQAARALCAQSNTLAGRTAIVEAHGIDALVRMLRGGSGSPAAWKHAGLTISNLASSQAGARQVASGRAIPVLVRLLDAEVSAADFSVQGELHERRRDRLEGCVRPLGSLATKNVKTAGAIPLLCQLLGKLRCECCQTLRQHTIRALSALARGNAANADAIAARDDGVPLLVALLEAPVPHTSVHAEAAWCLEIVAGSSDASRQAVADAGGLAAVERWRAIRAGQPEQLQQPRQEPDGAAAEPEHNAGAQLAGEPAVVPQPNGTASVPATAPLPAPPAAPSASPSSAPAVPTQAPAAAPAVPALTPAAAPAVPEPTPASAPAVPAPTPAAAPALPRTAPPLASPPAPSLLQRLLQCLLCLGPHSEPSQNPQHAS